jgi:phosphotriesterase-related protein
LVNDPELAGTELGHFAAAGGGTVVELTTPDLGRRPTELVEISRRTGINVVMCTGRYREPFYEESLDRTSTTALASEFIDEIERGVDGVRAGIIGEIGTHESFISPPEERVHRAAARAHIATGVAITTHANASPVGLSQLDLFEEEGVDLRRVVVGHCDTYPFLDYHRAILHRGAYVQYDTIRGNFEVETERQMDQLMTLTSEGHLERLLLSQDMGSNRFYKVYGGRGFDFLVTEFVERLRTRGLSQEELDILTIWNPRRMLTGEDVG